VKYIGHCSPFTSWTSTEFTASLDTDKYTMMGWPSNGFWMTGGLAKKFFNSLKTSSQLSSHLKHAVFFSRLKTGFILFAIFGMKRDSVVTLPISRCTSITVLGLCISMIA